MSDEIYWTYIVSVAEGAFEQFKDLIHELVDASRKEAGTIAYQFWTGDDGRTVNIFEHYEDSGAVVLHVEQTLSPFKERMASLTTVKSVTVHGNPDEAARQILDGWGSIYMAPIAGFSRGA